MESLIGRRKAKHGRVSERLPSPGTRPECDGLPRKRCTPLPSEWLPTPESGDTTVQAGAVAAVFGGSRGGADDAVDRKPQAAVLSPYAVAGGGRTGTGASVAAVEQVLRASPRVVVVDFETTGFSKDDEIIEIGAVEVLGRGSTRGGEFHSLVRPLVRTPHPKAAAVHGLRTTDLAQAPTIRDVLPRFLSFLSGNADECAGAVDVAAPLQQSTTIVAHNASFDVRMLRSAMAQLRARPSSSPPGNEPEAGTMFGALSAMCDACVCTQQIFSALFPQQGSSNLDAACYFFGISTVARAARHSAIVDARLTAELWMHIIAHVADLSEKA